jgi:hypothetical protein
LFEEFGTSSAFGFNRRVRDLDISIFSSMRDFCEEAKRKEWTMDFMIAAR